MDEITNSINAILKNLIKNFNTLLDCPARFSGDYNKQKVNSFIEYVEYYKRVKCISDEQALLELQYLLLDQANDWWLSRRKSFHTWSEALTFLENKYSKKRPANIIYTEILKQQYVDYDSEDDFVDDKLELLNELSQQELKESNKLEIIYSMLPNDVQNKVKLINISSIKQLKENLKAAKQDSGNANANLKITAEKDKTICSPPAELTSEDNNIQITVVGISSEAESNVDSDRDPIIKVRRTEDLMPTDIKEEEGSQTQQQEFLDNNNGSLGEKNPLHSNHNFQIDSDIMNQINSIIDETEINMNERNIKHQDTPSIAVQPTNSVKSLEFLGFHIEAKEPLNKTTEETSNSQITNKKIRKRCSYCRCTTHTTQICLKRAKQMKLYPERFLPKKTGNKNKILHGINNEPIDATNASINNNDLMNTQPKEAPLTTHIILNQIPTTSSLLDTSPAVTNSTVIVNSISEKCANPMLTTKLIAPINGKTPNKVLAAKLRSTNTPSPKCHQCGTLGFYKSICPNCSPIYNNNNHNQYNK